MPSAAFLSKETILPEEVDKSRKKTERKFKNFSSYNFFLFFVVVTAALIALPILTKIYPDHFEFNCDTIPPFHYSGECDHSSLIYDVFGETFPGHPVDGNLWA